MPVDVETGLVYIGARMHDPESARVMGIDPQGATKEGLPSFNRYA